MPLVLIDRGGRGKGDGGGDRWLLAIDRPKNGRKRMKSPLGMAMMPTAIAPRRGVKDGLKSSASVRGSLTE